jgi:hypothetical protein
MSQVVKAITSHDIGERKVFKGFTPLFQDVFNVKSDITELRYEEVAKAYRIGVTIGSQVWVTDLEAMTSEGALEEAISRTKKQVIEAIFGEFRTDFTMVERALYDRDFQKARDLLRIFEENMFSTE